MCQSQWVPIVLDLYYAADEKQSVYSDQYRISLKFVFVFCSHTLQAVSLSTLSIASSSSSSLSSSSSSFLSSFSFSSSPLSIRLPSDGPGVANSLKIK